MTKAIDDARAASNTFCKMIPDTLTHFTGKDGMERACYYLDGYLGPHYPVPAIKLEVDICKTWNDTVAIFEVETNKIVYDCCNSSWYNS